MGQGERTMWANLGLSILGTALGNGNLRFWSLIQGMGWNLLRQRREWKLIFLAFYRKGLDSYIADRVPACELKMWGRTYQVILTKTCMLQRGEQFDYWVPYTAIYSVCQGAWGHVLRCLTPHEEQLDTRSQGTQHRIQDSSADPRCLEVHRFIDS